MANQEHLDILKQGVETWNQWRGEHTDVKSDLSGAILKFAALQGADLSELGTVPAKGTRNAVLPETLPTIRAF